MRWILFPAAWCEPHPFASGIGVFDIVDDKTGRTIVNYDDQDDAREAARSIGQSDEVISGSEWGKRFNR